MINITIDGVVCSGKSTLAKGLAEKLGFKTLDTGAIFRAIACAFDDMGLDESKISEKYIKKFAEKINIEVFNENGKQIVLVNNKNFMQSIRTEHCSVLSAKLSPFQVVRDKVLFIQRDIAKKNNIVMEGRDIGSFVLPNADFKFFCTADVKVRAQRRFEQQKAAGRDVSFEQILKDIEERDFSDIHREHGALVVLPESIVVDTTNQSFEQSIRFCLNEMKKRGFDFKTQLPKS